MVDRMKSVSRLRTFTPLISLGLAAVLASLFVGCTRARAPISLPAAKPQATAVSYRSALESYLASGKPLFPRHRVIAYYGAADVPNMGVLGSAAPDVVAERLKRQAQAYDPSRRPVIAAFELIATAAQYAPGASGNYHAKTDDATIRRYLDAARKISALLIIDVQPGRSKFLGEVKRYEKFLSEPDVGLALDPEWEMSGTEVPGRTLGGTTGSEVNAVASYLASLVRRHHLPQKLFIIHQFTADMIAHRDIVQSPAELATTFHVDGFGARPNKLSKYNLLASRDPRFHNGIKLFYQKDINMFSASDVMKIRPQPDLVTYQ